MTTNAIVVGIDASPESQLAAQAGWQLAAALGVPCRLVHVVHDAWAALVAAQVPTDPDLTDEILRDARDEMVKTLSPVLPAVAMKAIEVQLGRPAAALAAAAEDAALVVVGGKVRGALARGIAGSTAHYLIRRLDTPVLIVRSPGWPFRRILAAVDLSFAAAPTIAAARAMARRAGARLRVLHVIEPIRGTRLGARVDKRLHDRASIAEFSRTLHDVPGIPARDRMVRRGPVVETTVAARDAWHADLLVVGSHGKGWVERMLVGSVTERLLASLPASLLVVPVRPTVPKRVRTSRTRTGRPAVFV